MEERPAGGDPHRGRGLGIGPEDGEGGSQLFQLRLGDPFPEAYYRSRRTASRWSNPGGSQDIEFQRATRLINREHKTKWFRDT